jgi:hypothetical protein
VPTRDDSLLHDQDFPPEHDVSARLNTGDPADDDGRIIDALFETNPNPPEALPNFPTIQPAKRSPVTNRLLTGTITLNPTDAPYQFLPADPRRISVGLAVYSVAGTATDYATISDDVGKLGIGFQSAFVMFHGKDRDLANGYTGALVASAINAAGAMRISWAAVTT